MITNMKKYEKSEEKIKYWRKNKKKNIIRALSAL